MTFRLPVTAGTRLSFSAGPPLSAFYRSVNSLSIRKPNESLFSNCVPCVTYASEVVEFNGSTMNNMNVALSDAIRRIFSSQRWERTQSLRLQLGYPNVTEIFHSRQKSF